MAKRDIIVIGGSAGGVEAMIGLARGLPSELKAAIFVVIHLSPQSAHALPKLLTRNGVLAASRATDGEAIEQGHIYVAPPDHHLLVKEGHIRVVRGPRENLHRPAIDPLFRSAAVAYDARVIGVILSGARDDGTSGLQAVKRRGGIAVVQDPDDALFTGMPSSALEHVEVDHCISLAEIPDLLVRLAAEEFEAHTDPVPEDLWLEARMVENLMTTMESEQKLGRPALLSCPDCGGALWELDDELLRFRCHLGHAYTAENLLAGQASTIEHALWAALRALRERASMMERLAERMHTRGQPRIAARFETHRDEAERHGEVIRELLINNGWEEDPARKDG